MNAWKVIAPLLASFIKKKEKKVEINIKMTKWA